MKRLVLRLRKGAVPAKARGKGVAQARGLVLEQSKSNPRVRRWVKHGPPDSKDEPKPQSKAVKFRHPKTGEDRTGAVQSGGPHGVTVVDHASGEAHKVAHGQYIDHDAGPGEEKPGKAGGGGAAQAGGGKAKEPERKKWAEEHPGLERYPPKNVKDEDVEVAKHGDNVNWRLRWPHPKTGKPQRGYELSYLKANAERKFRKVVSFGHLLPQFRDRVGHHLSLGGASTVGTMAAMARIVDKTLMRAGGKSDETTGLTTLKKSHVTVDGDTVRFSYVGKAGVPQSKRISDPRVAAVVGHLLDNGPGDHLFQSQDHRGEWTPITAAKIRGYIGEHTGGGKTKDFRTFHATRIFSEEVDRLGPPSSPEDAEEKIKQAAMVVASELGHFKSKKHKHFAKVAKRATGAHGKAQEYGGKHYGDGLVGFHTASARKAYQRGIGKTASSFVPKGQHPENIEPEWSLETGTALNSYIDPTVIEAYRGGLTLSGGTMRKAVAPGADGLSVSERRFMDYLHRVDKADPYGIKGSPEED